jgi:hypothetical protein
VKFIVDLEKKVLTRNRLRACSESSNQLMIKSTKELAHPLALDPGLVSGQLSQSGSALTETSSYRANLLMSSSSKPK